MTKQTNQTNGAKPDLIIKAKVVDGSRSRLDTIGVAWTRDEGGFYCKLYGRQIIEDGFYVFPTLDDAEQPGRPEASYAATFQ